jgi:hypothetical protein
VVHIFFRQGLLILAEKIENRLSYKHLFCTSISQLISAAAQMSPVGRRSSTCATVQRQKEVEEIAIAENKKCDRAATQRNPIEA